LVSLAGDDNAYESMAKGYLKHLQDDDSKLRQIIESAKKGFRAGNVLIYHDNLDYVRSLDKNIRHNIPNAKSGVIINLESVMWNNEETKQELLRQEEGSSERLDRIANLLKDVTDAPVVLSSFIERDELVENNPRFKELFNKSNVTFFREPLGGVSEINDIFRPDKDSE